jgi:hypothetical protein
MPKFEVETDKGKFEFELDREPESQEQLMQIAQDYIVKNPDILKPKGLVSEAATRASDTFMGRVKGGIDTLGGVIHDYLNPVPSKDEKWYSNLLRPATAAFGAMEIASAPVGAAVAAAGTVPRRALPEGYSRENLDVGLGKFSPADAAEFGVEMFINPYKTGKKVLGLGKRAKPVVDVPTPKMGVDNINPEAFNQPALEAEKRMIELRLSALKNSGRGKSLVDPVTKEKVSSDLLRARIADGITKVDNMAKESGEVTVVRSGDQLEFGKRHTTEEPFKPTTLEGDQSYLYGMEPGPVPDVKPRGFDMFYSNPFADPELIKKAVKSPLGRGAIGAGVGYATGDEDTAGARAALGFGLAAAPYRRMMRRGGAGSDVLDKFRYPEAMAKGSDAAESIVKAAQSGHYDTNSLKTYFGQILGDAYQGLDDASIKVVNQALDTPGGKSSTKL